MINTFMAKEKRIALHNYFLVIGGVLILQLISMTPLYRLFRRIDKLRRRGYVPTATTRQ